MSIPRLAAIARSSSGDTQTAPGSPLQQAPQPRHEKRNPSFHQGPVFEREFTPSCPFLSFRSSSWSKTASQDRRAGPTSPYIVPLAGRKSCLQREGNQKRIGTIRTGSEKEAIEGRRFPLFPRFFPSFSPETGEGRRSRGRQTKSSIISHFQTGESPAFRLSFYPSRKCSYFYQKRSTSREARL